jgi:hypothetical protein
MDPITGISEALASLKLGTLLEDAFETDLHEFEAREWRDCKKDMQDFADAVLAGNGAHCTLLIGGLRHDGPAAPELTSSGVDRLRGAVLSIDGGTLLRLYCLSREGDAAASIADFVKSEAIKRRSA